ncbi:MAG: Basal-body rod modification protein FlgD [Smithella sp. PtaU1.Bin162]|jgi:flagellar basal-body rod modification protein FlgD|nr:MAG: Basal-body rod modification protein FlgD [Smithella sp. PtaU1.Bin162]
MTTVNNVISGLVSSQAGTTATSSAAYDLGADDFMTMLIAELENQNPLDPMDGKDFAAQLAQFSSLSQLSALNTTMSSLPTYLKAFSNAQMVGMIGKEAVANGNVVTVSGSSTDISFSLPSDIATGTLNIYNSSGIKVGSADLGSLEAGINSITWNTSSIDAGKYTIEINAADAGGNAVTAATLITGTVTGTSFKDDTTYLTINGQEVEFSDVVSINKSTD